jgi:putative phosphoribosyl transferase
MAKLFKDRQDAGRRLAVRLSHLRDRQPVVLALPRGGVPVGCEVAAALDAPLDLVLVRKLGAPGMREFAIGAIVNGERLERVLDERTAAELDVPQRYLDEETAIQAKEIDRRSALYLQGRPPVPLTGRCAVVVDDGIATGATMRAALLAIRRRGPSEIVLAVPVAPPDTIDALRTQADDVVCLARPTKFFGISQFYDDFHQIGDEEVLSCLHQVDRSVPEAPRKGDVERPSENSRKPQGDDGGTG